MASGHPKSLISGSYPYWFMLPAGVVFTVLFIVPTAIAFYFSLTRWTLFDSEFIGLDNFRQFFDEPSLTTEPSKHDHLCSSRRPDRRSSSAWRSLCC